MLNINNASLLKKNCIVINPARGEVISLEALDLLSDRIYGIGLDVIEGEKMLFKNVDALKQKEIIKRDNVLYTPHMAYFTKEALDRIREKSLKNLIAFIEGMELLDKIKVCEH